MAEVRGAGEFWGPPEKVDLKSLSSRVVHHMLDSHFLPFQEPPAADNSHYVAFVWSCQFGGEQANERNSIHLDCSLKSVFWGIVM